MQEKSYADFVEKKLKDGQAILDGLDSDKANLLHIAMGISGEAGELLDAVKKHVIYSKPLDMANVKEELGDLEFYMQAFRNWLGVERTNVIISNVNKLNERYEKGYSDKEASLRRDKG